MSDFVGERPCVSWKALSHVRNAPETSSALLSSALGALCPLSMRVERCRAIVPSIVPWLRWPEESTTNVPAPSLKDHCPNSPGVIPRSGACMHSRTCWSVRATFHRRTSSISPSHAALLGCAPMQKSAFWKCSASISSSFSALNSSVSCTTPLMSNLRCCPSYVPATCVQVCGSMVACTFVVAYPGVRKKLTVGTSSTSPLPAPYFARPKPVFQPMSALDTIVAYGGNERASTHASTVNWFRSEPIEAPCPLTATYSVVSALSSRHARWLKLVKSKTCMASCARSFASLPPKVKSSPRTHAHDTVCRGIIPWSSLLHCSP
mmetsp:Transcript_20849/g.52890  ORF Transcript_20849/g.52890 Transcript_20849/m.52890 type:complete len:320 (-) Transcript_20849:1548-2507(-)